MIRRVCFSVFTLKLTQKRFLNLNNQIFYFNSLPKPSRFSEELGLHRQFINLNAKMKKQQRSTIALYQFVIWAAFCLIGSFTLSALIKPEIREKINLGLQLINLNFKGKSDDYSNQHKSLEKVVGILKQFYKNKPYSDSASYKIIRRCLGDISTINQKCDLLLLEALQINLKNTKNIQNNFELYRDYFHGLLSSEKNLPNAPTCLSQAQKQNKSKCINKILSHLLQYADLQTMYLIFYLRSLHYFQINSEDRQKCKQRLQHFKLKNLQMAANINEEIQKNRQIFLQPCQFSFNIQAKWIRFIQKFI